MTVGLLGDLEDTVRSDDGTLLPRTVAPTTGEQALLRALPRLDRDAVAQDLVLGETLGRGGMGVVRLADQRAVGRRVAVKQLLPERRHDPAQALYLLREAWVTGALEHPNIVPVHGVGVDEHGGPLIVMKRVEGRSWSSVIHQERQELRWHLRILMAVCSAVDFAASRGFVHRDLKPDNVMIGSFGEVYVLDWGIAVSLGDDHGGRIPRAVDVDGIAGTPGYMAPEMVRAVGELLTPRTDVYLLGSILHELLTKARRHQGGTLQATLLAALESAPYTYPPHLPRELVAIVEQANAREPEQRYATAGELRAALELFLEHESSRELVDQAELRLAAWAALPDAAARPVEVQRYFGEARFALQQALRAWPDNERARTGLERALRLKFAHDLARDDLEAAAVALEELGATDTVLGEQLEALRQRVELRRRELGGLRQLQAARDLDVGHRTRAFLMVISAVIFGAVTPLGWWLGYTGQSGYPYYYAAGVVKLVGGLVFARWAWDTLSKTAVNRQLTATIQLMGVAELIVYAFTQNLGRSVENALYTGFAVYVLITATVAITIDRRLSVSALVYMAGALATHGQLERVYVALGLSHLVAGLVAAYVWRPRPRVGVGDEAVAT